MQAHEELRLIVDLVKGTRIGTTDAYLGRSGPSRLPWPRAVESAALASRSPSNALSLRIRRRRLPAAPTASMQVSTESEPGSMSVTQSRPAPPAPLAAWPRVASGIAEFSALPDGHGCDERSRVRMTL